jgi:ParB family chromosome partitioning protein
MQAVLLPVNLLIPDSGQPRKTMPDTELAFLIESIRSRGLLLPLRVKPSDAQGRHLIVSGHRRHAALVALDRTHAECILVEGPLDEATILAEQFVENIHREDLSSIDEANSYRRYMTLRNITAAQTASELNVSASRISRMLPLLELPEDFQRKINDGSVAAEVGYYITRIPTGEERDRLMLRALEGKLTRDETARAVKTARREPSGTTAVNRVTCKLTAGRTLTISGEEINTETAIEILEEVLKEARRARSQGWEVRTLAKVFRDRAAVTGGVE